MNQNDVREAIEDLKSINVFSNKSEVGQKRIAAIKLAISALEKQLAKPPEHKVHEKYKALGMNHYCSCGVMFVDFERNGTDYCGKCGQKLKEDCND